MQKLTYRKSIQGLFGLDFIRNFFPRESQGKSKALCKNWHIENQSRGSFHRILYGISSLWNPILYGISSLWNFWPKMENGRSKMENGNLETSVACRCWFCLARSMDSNLAIGKRNCREQEKWQGNQLYAGAKRKIDGKMMNARVTSMEHGKRQTRARKALWDVPKRAQSTNDRQNVSA